MPLQLATRIQERAGWLAFVIVILAAWLVREIGGIFLPLFDIPEMLHNIIIGLYAGSVLWGLAWGKWMLAGRCETWLERRAIRYYELNKQWSDDSITL